MVMTYRVGAAGSQTAGVAMAEYYGGAVDVPEMAERLAAYMTSQMAPDQAGHTAAIPRRDMHPAIAQLLEIDLTRSLSQAEAANLMRGLTTTGEAIEGKRTFKSTEKKTALGYVDFTFSAPKSFSVALALAPTWAEKAVLEECFIQANDWAMSEIMRHIGVIKTRDKENTYTSVPGHMASFAYDHYTARPTLAQEVEENGVRDTVLVNLPSGEARSAPNRHRHNIVPMAVLGDDGKVQSADLNELDGMMHIFGGLAHARLSTLLKQRGIRTEIDTKTKLLRLSDVPRWATELYTDRGKEGEVLARQYAERRGLDWDTMAAKDKAEMITGMVKSSRRAKDGKVDYAEWQRRAADAGYEHRSVLRPDRIEPLPSREERARVAYGAFLRLLEPELKGRAKLDGSVVRTAAARAHIEAGIVVPDDINLVTSASRTEGVMQDGRMTKLIWRQEEDRDTHRLKPFYSVTTGLHVEEETEAIELIRAATADTTAAAPKHLFEAKVRKMEARGLRFDTEHGKSQLALAEAAIQGGRDVVGIGGAGSGKSTALEIPIAVYHAMGWRSYGATQAWRQTHGLVDAGVTKNRRVTDTGTLVDAGIDPDRAMALEAFFVRAEKGLLALDNRTIVVLDEVGTTSTHDTLRMARLRAQYNFKTIKVGDEEQCGSIDAGATMDLYRNALGPDAIPAVVGSIRQRNLEDRAISLAFRNGNAGEALTRKAQKGDLRFVEGGYTETLQAGLAEYDRRIAANANNPDYNVAITVADNADVHEVGLQIRKRHRAVGKIVGEDVRIATIDQRGVEREMDLAVGDTIRFYNRVNARYSNKSRGYFGENGTTGKLVAIVPNESITVERSDGKIGTIRWGSLTDKLTGRIRLSYGTALTINARQSATNEDHLTLMPGGSAAWDKHTVYPADTRNKGNSLFFVSRGAEMEEVRNRRPLGDPWFANATREQIDAEILKNMARNLNRDDRKTLAVDFLDSAMTVFHGAVDSRKAAWFRNEGAAARGQEPDFASGFRDRQDEDDVTRLIGDIRKLTYAGRKATTRDEVRSVRAPAERPKSKPKWEFPKIDEAAAIADFADALRAEGFVFTGAPVMDGKWHYERVASRSNNKKGRYRGYLDGRPAGAIQSFKGGDEVVRWKYQGTVSTRSDAERERDAAARREREVERRNDMEKAAQRAIAAWKAGKHVTRHAYLTKKGISAYGLRQDNRGNLLVALRDPATMEVRNLQTIVVKRDGGTTKLFAKGAQYKGLMGLIGKIDPEGYCALAEGMATAATFHETTSFPTAYSFTGGNLLDVALALKVLYPNLKIIVAGDNDHHLPRQEKPTVNVGREKAMAAAAGVGGIAIIPSFGSIETEPLTPGKSPPTDWNDHRDVFTPPVHKEIVRQALLEQGIVMPETPQSANRAPLTQAERDRAWQQAQPSAPPSQSQAQAAAAAQAVQRQQQEQRRHNRGPEL